MDREDGFKNCRAKRDRDNLGKRGGMRERKNRRIQSSGHVFANERNRFILRTTSSHVSIPQNRNGTIAKDKYVR